MTDSFLDDHATLILGRQLRDIAKHLPQALAIARREVSPPGGRTARNPNVPGSRPPMNLGALDTHNDLTITLQGWTRCLLDDAHVHLPTEVDAPSLARHLARHAHQIAQQQWAADMADEIGDHHRQLRGLTDPDEPESIADRHSLADVHVHHRAHQAYGDVRDMVVLHLAVTGDDLPESTIRRWAKDKRMVEYVGDSGEPKYAYAEVAQLARMRKARKTRRSGTRVS